MKRISAMILCISMMLATAVYAGADSAAVNPRYSIVNNTSTQFSIVNDTAIINTSYTADYNNFSSANIKVKLQKKFLLVFWRDVNEWEVTSNEAVDFYEFSCDVSSGTHRIQVKYEIVGLNGAVDVIEDEIEKAN